jgi:hypothetical protein
MTDDLNTYIPEQAAIGKLEERLPRPQGSNEAGGFVECNDGRFL